MRSSIDINHDYFTGILDIIQAETLLRPSNYSETTLLTAIQNRMEILNLKKVNIYIKLLRNNAKEINYLGREILDIDKKVEYEKLYKTLYNNSFDGIILYNRNQNKIIDANPTMELLFGYTTAELKQMTPIDLLDDTVDAKFDSSELLKDTIQQITLDSEFNYTFYHRTKNREGLKINISLLPLHLKDEFHLLMIYRNISEILDLEQGNFAFEINKFKNIFDFQPLGISIANMNNIIVDANAAFAEVIGYSINELIGYSFDDLTYKDYPHNLLKIEQLLQGELDFVQVEKMYRKKDGTPFFAKVWVNIFEKNNERYFISCIEDITEKRQKNLEITEKEERYRALFNHSKVGIIVIDFELGIAIDVNPAAIRIFDAPREYLLVSSMPEQSPKLQPNGKSSATEIQEILTNFKKNQKEISINWQFKKTRSGKLFDAIVTFTPITLNGKNATVMIVEDLTEKNEARKKIKNQTVELTKKNIVLKKYIESNLELESFAYVASHDLKEPLRSISNFTQLLQKKYSHQFDDNAHEYMNFIVESVKGMNILIQDLLTYSRVSTKELEIKYFDLNHLISNIIGLNHSYPESKNIEFTINDLPSQLKGNRTKMKQVFQNLIGNAVKFSKKDAQPIHIEINSIDENTHWHFYVKDNGIGIHEDYMEKIFLIFKRLHTRSEYEGSGIGLAICKKIVEQHGGEIWVESEFGEGSTFHFTIKKDLQNLF